MSGAERPPTDVVLAVDTAFALPGDPFRPIGERLVSCPVEGRSEGLSFLLDLFGWYGLTASFFVETGQTRTCGDAPMGRVVERIHQSEQDVQLLIDPRWAAAASDEPADPDRLLADGLAAMSRWGVPRPVAARRLDGRSDAAFRRATAAHGLLCACSDETAAERARRQGGRAATPRVADVPAARMRALLRRANAAGISAVTIGLSVWDFVTARDAGFRALRADRRAQYRLERLGELLQEDGAFRCAGLAAAVGRGRPGPPSSRPGPQGLDSRGRAPIIGA